ncbi:MAG TPA: V-type ATP synthase subunit D [Streptosporangiaceae bacterium]|nr:V-type ATP synthase subunit D [Streptosporangiaceae bacterium]
MSTTGLAVPPGRAGRLWLVRRLAIARRAADLLDRKLRVLAAELDRARAAAERTGQEWNAACHEAQRRLLRAVLLGGERAVRLAADVADAQVTISYTVTMGARHPAEARYTMSEPEGWDGAAVAGARQAHRTALAAAVRHAAATAAVAVIEAETNATRYRLRAVRDRWVPRLSRALAEVEFALEEQERADAARLRMSRRRPTWKD